MPDDDGIASQETNTPSMPDDDGIGSKRSDEPSMPDGNGIGSHAKNDTAMSDDDGIGSQEKDDDDDDLKEKDKCALQDADKNIDYHEKRELVLRLGRKENTIRSGRKVQEPAYLKDMITQSKTTLCYHIFWTSVHTLQKKSWLS